LSRYRLISFLKRLALGNGAESTHNDFNQIQKSVANLKSVWNNSTTQDVGIERITRLLLALSVFALPGIYVKSLLHHRRVEMQDLVTDVYVGAKLLLPIVILKFELYQYWTIHALQIVLILETMLYIPMLIFASDFFTKPRTYRRSLILLFINYAELVFGYAVLYSMSGTLNHQFSHWFDAVYFSAVTAATIGYGDYFPVTIYGKVIVSMQSMAFLVFGVLFLSFFTTRLERIGYFKSQMTNTERNEE